jgi:tetratricopeptide (TPR) repeat protein
MKQRMQPRSTAARNISATADSFALAAEQLGGQRPLRSRHLQQIGSNIDKNHIAFAETELTEYLARRPDDVDALNLMARTQLRLGRREAAAALLAQCLVLAPDFAAARFNHAELLFKLKDFDAALKELDRLLISDSRNPLFRQLKANILESTGENERSLAICEELAGENPGRAESWISYGHALRAMGFQEKSIAAYRKALEVRPSFGMAYWSLANMKTVHFSDDDIAAMQEQLNRPDIATDDRVHLQFSLGKAYEDLGVYDRSFEQYAKANAAMRVRVGYNPENVTKLVTSNKTLLTPEFLRNRAGVGCSARDPIFVVSLPRSGSTLIEQILSSHSAIEGTAELPYITAIAKRLETGEGALTGLGYPKILEALEPAALKSLGEEYLEQARAHRKLGRPFFIDKKPPNWFHVGLIHLILPNAKIIDARRNPVACCLSMFKQYFNKPRPRQAELARFYRDYVDLMAHFDAVLPGKVHRVIYEDMVANPETEVRRLLDYLGLPFEEGCLRFYETKRSVLTPSSEQVRKPISGEAVDHWRNYEPWLGPLIEGLGPILTAYPSVPEALR